MEDNSLKKESPVMPTRQFFGWVVAICFLLSVVVCSGVFIVWIGVAFWKLLSFIF